MNTTENNKLIAEFMGARFRYLSYIDLDQYNFGKTDRTWKDNKDMHYHDSWDWLMHVVEKIESLGAKVEISTSPRNSRHYCEMRGYGFAHEWDDNKINAVYKAVVEFVKWYNNIKNRNNEK